jgi:hypothetical protein
VTMAASKSSAPARARAPIPMVGSSIGDYLCLINLFLY